MGPPSIHIIHGWHALLTITLKIHHLSRSFTPGSSVLILKLALFEANDDQGDVLHIAVLSQNNAEATEVNWCHTEALVLLSDATAKGEVIECFHPQGSGGDHFGVLGNHSCLTNHNPNAPFKDDTRSNMATFVGKSRYIFPTWSIWVIFEA